MRKRVHGARGLSEGGHWAGLRNVALHDNLQQQRKSRLIEILQLLKKFLIFLIKFKILKTKKLDEQKNTINRENTLP